MLGESAHGEGKSRIKAGGGEVLDQKNVTSKPLLQLLQGSERMEGAVCERVSNKS